LPAACDAAWSRLQAQGRSMEHFAASSERLVSKKDALVKEATAIAAFQRRYELRRGERRVLRSRRLPTLAALARTPPLPPVNTPAAAAASSASGVASLGGRSPHRHPRLRFARLFSALDRLATVRRDAVLILTGHTQPTPQQQAQTAGGLQAEDAGAAAVSASASSSAGPGGGRLQSLLGLPLVESAHEQGQRAAALLGQWCVEQCAAAGQGQGQVQGRWEGGGGSSGGGESDSEDEDWEGRRGRADDAASVSSTSSSDSGGSTSSAESGSSSSDSDRHERTGRRRRDGGLPMDAASAAAAEADSILRAMNCATAVNGDTADEGPVEAGGREAGLGGGRGAAVAVARMGSPVDLLRVALTYLAECRPLQLRPCQEAYATARSSDLTRRFLLALGGGGGAQGGGRASLASSASCSSGSVLGASALGHSISLSAHDPIRYVSDILAWMLGALAEEAEAATAIFGSVSGGTSDTMSFGAADASSDAPSASASAALGLSEVLEQLTSAIARPLTLRIDHALANAASASSSSSSSSASPSSAGATSDHPLSGAGVGEYASLSAALVQLYGAIDVLEFYSNRLQASASVAPPASRTASSASLSSAASGASSASSTAAFGSGGWQLSPDSALVSALRGCKEKALARYVSVLDSAGRHLSTRRDFFQADLSTSPLVFSVAFTLTELLKCEQRPMSQCLSALPSLGMTASKLLEPLLLACRQGMEGLKLADTACFMVNCLSALHSALLPFAQARSSGVDAAGTEGEAASLWAQRLSAETTQWCESLVQEACSESLAGTDVLTKMSAMRTFSGAAAGSAGATMSRSAGLTPAEILPCVTQFADTLRSFAGGAGGATGRGVDLAASFAGQRLPAGIRSGSCFDRIDHPGIRGRLRRDLASVLLAAWTRLQGDVLEPVHGYVADVETAADDKARAAASALVSLVREFSPAKVALLLDLK
jgi:hypothetical protein